GLAVLSGSSLPRMNRRMMRNRRLVGASAGMPVSQGKCSWLTTNSSWKKSSALRITSLPRVEKTSRPQLQREDEPEELAMVGFTGQVGLQIALCGILSHEAPLGEAAAADDVGGQPLERPAKPLAERDAETLLRLLQDGGRQIAGGHATQEVLAAAVLHAQ